MHRRFLHLASAVIARATSWARQGGIARGCSIAGRATPTAVAAAALLIAGSPGVGRGAPPTCADVLKSIEKRLAQAGVRHPPLKIVPKNLATGYRVVGTCEGGTQRIVHDAEPAASPNDAGKKKGKPESASAR